MMKKITFSLISIFSLTLSYSQTLGPIQWQKCLGGSGFEIATSIQPTSDGGYITAGYSDSNDGDVSGNHGSNDVWVVKLNGAGIIQWQKSLGGSGGEGIGISSIKQTTDGGYIVSASASVNDGDVSGNHGYEDAWVVKLNSVGVIEWQKCLGGSLFEGGQNIQETSDGGYILASYSNSNDGDATAVNGSLDVWVVKLSNVGVIQWQKCLGGSAVDISASIQQTMDGGYILASYSGSNDIDVFGNHGGADAWIVKLNSAGLIEWQRCIGGTGSDFGWYIQQTTDGGYVFAGSTDSNDGDVSGNHGSNDVWVVKLNAIGIIQWQKCLGGTGSEGAEGIEQTSDGGYIVIGNTTASADGDVSGNHGITDVWTVKLTDTGTLQWQRCLGGTGTDFGYSIQLTTDGGYVFAGHTDSNDGDVSGNHGAADVWVVKFLECNASTNSSSTLNVSSCTSYTTPLGQVLTSTGTYTEVIPNNVGCDSSITINFTKYDAVLTDVTVYTCSLPYSWNSQSYPTYGSYTQVLQTVHGCDSTVNLTLSYFPQVQEICIVGIDPTTGKNKVVWEKDQTDLITNYNVYSENTQAGVFDLIGTTNYADSSVFLDLIANPNQQAYRYQIKYVDTCGIESGVGSTHKTLHLTINQGIGTTWNLIWTAYEGITYPSYNIYRGTNASNMSLLTTVSSNLTSYTDASAPVGLVYYQIEIVSPNNCNPAKSPYNNSKSNVSTNDPSYLGLDQNALNSILIFPNPASNQINIEYPGQIQKLEIVDLKGSKVYSTNENKKVYALPTNIQTGYYMLVMYTNEGVFRKELMIQR